MDIRQSLLILTKCVILGLAISFVGRMISWIRRIRMVRKYMPVIPTLLPPDSHFRRIWPKKWQTFHQDWNMQYKRTWYHKLKSDNFALICLFQYDRVYLSEPDAVNDLNIDKSDRFLKDKQIFRKVQICYVAIADGLVCGVWTKCGHDSRR